MADKQPRILLVTGTIITRKTPSGEEWATIGPVERKNGHLFCTLQRQGYPDEQVGEKDLAEATWEICVQERHARDAYPGIPDLNGAAPDICVRVEDNELPTPSGNPSDDPIEDL